MADRRRGVGDGYRRRSSDIGGPPSLTPTGDMGHELQGVAAEPNSAVMDADHPDEGLVSAAVKQLQAAALVHRDAVRWSGG